MRKQSSGVDFLKQIKYNPGIVHVLILLRSLVQLSPVLNGIPVSYPYPIPRNSSFLDWNTATYKKEGNLV